MISPLRGSFSASTSYARASSNSAGLLRIDETVELENEYENKQWNYGPFFIGCLSGALSDLNYTLLVAFFPKAAKKKGLSPTAVGVVLGVYQLCNFLMCFFCPKIVGKIGPKHALFLSNALQALFVGLMIIPGEIDDSIGFFCMVFFLRCLQGCVAALQEVSALGIIIRSVPTAKVPEGITYSEVSRIVGTISGPLVGGALFQAGGFDLPFIVSASLLGANSLLIMFAEVSLDRETKEDAPKNITKRFLRQPVIHICLASMFFIAVAISFFEPSLQEFLQAKPFNFSHTAVGGTAVLPSLVFVVVGSAVTPLLSKISKEMGVLIGFFLVTASYFIIAPPKECDSPLTIFSFLHQDSFGGALALFLSGMTIQGASLVFFFIPISNMLTQESTYIGLTLEESADHVAAFVNQSITFGAFFGPLFNGAIVHSIGFPKSCAVMGWLGVLYTLVVVSCAFYIYKKRREEEPDTDLSEALLENENIEGAAPNDDKTPKIS